MTFSLIKPKQAVYLYLNSPRLSIPAAISFHLPFLCTKGTVGISRTENPFVNLRGEDQIQFKEGPEGDDGLTGRCAVQWAV